MCRKLSQKRSRVEQIVTSKMRNQTCDFMELTFTTSSAILSQWRRSASKHGHGDARASDNTVPAHSCWTRSCQKVCGGKLPRISSPRKAVISHAQGNCKQEAKREHSVTSSERFCASRGRCACLQPGIMVNAPGKETIQNNFQRSTQLKQMNTSMYAASAVHRSSTPTLAPSRSGEIKP